MRSSSNAFPKTFTVTVPIQFGKKGGRKVIVGPGPLASSPAQFESSLIKALARAYRWRQMIESGRFSSITELADVEGLNQSYACRLLRLTLLAPAIVNAILNGSQPRTLQLDDLIKPLPADWGAQTRLIL